MERERNNMTLTELFNIADFTDEKGMLFNKNCMELLPLIGGGYNRFNSYRHSI